MGRARSITSPLRAYTLSGFFSRRTRAPTGGQLRRVRRAKTAVRHLCRFPNTPFHPRSARTRSGNRHRSRAARIGWLPPVEKDLLQTLSVIGKEFLLTLVRVATAKLDDDLERMLRNPTAARLSDAGAFRALCTE